MITSSRIILTWGGLARGTQKSTPGWALDPEIPNEDHVSSYLGSLARGSLRYAVCEENGSVRIIGHTVNAQTKNLESQGFHSVRF